MAAVDLYHGDGGGGWGDFLNRGLSALGTRLALRGYRLAELRKPLSAEQLKAVDVLVIACLGGRPFGTAEADAVLAFVRGGGRLLVIVPDNGVPSLTEYGRVLLPFGIPVRLGTVATYREVPPRRYEWIEDAAGANTWLDESGADVVGSGEQIMMRARALEVDDARLCVLRLHGRCVVAGLSLGEGAVLAAGSDDLFSNEALSERLNYPLDMTGGYPEVPANVAVRDHLLERLLAGGGPLHKRVSAFGQAALLQRLADAAFEPESLALRGLRYFAPEY